MNTFTAIPTGVLAVDHLSGTKPLVVIILTRHEEPRLCDEEPLPEDVALS